MSASRYTVGKNGGCRGAKTFAVKGELPELTEIRHNFFETRRKGEPGKDRWLDVAVVSAAAVSSRWHYASSSSCLVIRHTRIMLLPITNGRRNWSMW